MRGGVGDSDNRTPGPHPDTADILDTGFDHCESLRDAGDCRSNNEVHIGGEGAFSGEGFRGTVTSTGITGPFLQV
jgi:hypothetical protein